jgi:hypothetical protein
MQKLHPVITGSFVSLPPLTHIRERRANVRIRMDHAEELTVTPHHNRLLSGALRTPNEMIFEVVGSLRDR